MKYSLSQVEFLFKNSFMFAPNGMGKLPIICYFCWFLVIIAHIDLEKLYPPPAPVKGYKGITLSVCLSRVNLTLTITI